MRNACGGIRDPSEADAGGAEAVLQRERALANGSAQGWPSNRNAPVWRASKRAGAVPYWGARGRHAGGTVVRRSAPFSGGSGLRAGGLGRPNDIPTRLPPSPLARVTSQPPPLG